VNLWDIVLIVLLLAAVALAVAHCVRVRRRGGSSCCGNCAQCGASCGKGSKSGKGGNRLI
jgi:hypothetical protein